jgi:hypothetical protein
VRAQVGGSVVLRMARMTVNQYLSCDDVSPSWSTNLVTMIKSVAFTFSRVESS